MGKVPEEEKKLSQLDLCSGVGAGFPLAGIRTGGFKLTGLCENYKYCRDILTKRFPGVPIYGDVQSLPRQPEIDIITASPPCQPFSVQGKRQGAADERDCIPYILEAIAINKPKFFCIENVPGLLSCPLRPGEPDLYFNCTIRFLTTIGYDTEWLSLGSGHLSAPFLRKRLLLVGIARSLIKREIQTPGQSRLEARLKQDNVLVKGECLNPNWLEHWLNLPQNWTNPSELRTATQLIDADDKHWVMRLIHKSGRSRSKESNISIPCVIKKPGRLTVDGVIVGDCGDKFRVKVGDSLTTVAKLYVYPNFPSHQSSVTSSQLPTAKTNSPSKKCRTLPITPSKKCRTFANSPSKNQDKCPIGKDQSPLVTGNCSVITESNSPSKKRRKNGEGNGTLYQKALVKNGKTYSQWWYQWKVGNKKRTKYVNKKVLGLVQELEERKAPVIEILKVLGVEPC